MAGEQIKTPAAALRFMFSGNAVLTVVNRKSGSRLTFKIQRAKEAKHGRRPWFVKLGSGPAFDYIGLIGERSQDTPDARLRVKRGGTLQEQRGVAAFEWILRTLNTSKMAATITPLIEIWHEGKCGRCARPLTDPESIKTGFGPECRKRMGL